jgi:UDP-2-acetamido-2-deoxy-ribo-hexuluronate aminotransferase
MNKHDTGLSSPRARIPFIDLQAQRKRIEHEIDAAIRRVLEHGAFIMGPEIDELEAQLAERVGVSHVLTCASGTDALLLPLMALGIGPGDAVFVPAFGFVAPAEVACLVGATPVFVDVLPGSGNLDPDSLAAAVETAQAKNFRPKAIIAIDLYGLPADYDRLGAFARDRGLVLIEDAAQSFGAVRHGKAAGSLAPVAGTSFFPAKPLGCYGDGGAIFTNDPDWAERIRRVRTHGQGSGKYNHVAVGLNGRLDTLQAAILIQKLTIFDDEMERRQQVARRYSERLADVSKVPQIPPGHVSAWAQYTIQVRRRDAVIEALSRRNIPTAVHYPRPITAQTAYAGGPAAPGGVPLAEALAGTVLSLPMHPYLEPDEQDWIIENVQGAITDVGWE